jgi:hypothetical protein
MAIFASLIARLGMDTSAWTAGNTKAREEVEKTKKSTGGFFKELDSLFGKKAYKSSDFAQLVKLAAGGGAVAGLSMAAGSVKNMTASILDMQKAFRSGNLSRGDLADSVASSIPVFGSLYGAARDVREMLIEVGVVGGRSLSQLEKDAARSTETLKRLQEDLANATAARALRNNIAEEVANDTQAAELAGLEGTLRDIRQAEFDAENATRRLKATVDEQVKKDPSRAQGLYTAEAQRVVSIEARKEAEIERIRGAAARKHMDETERLMKDRRREELATIAETEREQVGALNRLKSKLEQDMKDGEKTVAYRTVNTPSVRGGFAAVNAPDVQTKIVSLNQQQVEQLKRVNDALHRLGQKTDDEILVTIPGI